MKAAGTRLLIVFLVLVWPLCVVGVELLEFLVRVLWRGQWRVQYRAFWREFKEGRFR